MKIYNNPKDPKHWKTIETEKHKYLVIGWYFAKKQEGWYFTRKQEYEVFHRDDCTLNISKFLFVVKGNIQAVKKKIALYESRSNV